ncbi:unnamed protein product [Closterium sp. Naga37s-1]|nr:unnamed protein product [Closterium sp. Naga37s-1]
MADLRASKHETVTCERVVRIVTQAENAAAAAQAPHVTQCSARAENAPVFESSQPQAVQPAGLVRAPDCALAEDAGEHAHSAEELGERAQLAEGQLDLAELQARVVGSQLQLLRGMLAEREEQVRAVMAELAGMRARVVRARNVAEQSPRGICRSRSAAQGRCAGGSAADAEETTGAGKTGFAAGGSLCGRKEAAGNAGIAGNRENQGTRNCYTGRASFSVPASLMSSRRASTDRRPGEASQALSETHAAAAAASAAAAVATGAGGGGEASACASECLEAAAELQQVEMSVASTEAWLWEVEAAAAEARDVFLQAEEEAAAAAVGAAGAAGEGGAAAGGEQGGRTIHSGGFRHELALSEKAFTEELYRRLAQLQADLIEAGEGERVLQGILQGLEGSKGTVGKLLLTGMDGWDGWGGGVGGRGGYAGEGGDGRGVVEDYEEALILQQALEYLKQQQMPAVVC